MIPNQLHYVHLSQGGRQWKLHHYLSVKSAYVRSGVKKIYIWVDNEPTGEWWDKTKNLVQIEKIQPPTEIFGKPITEQAHKSDVLRLQILLEYGGVYVDTDTIFTKSFTPLLDNKFVLGQQNVGGSEGLCPAVILSEPNSIFGKNWLAGFKDSFGGGPPGSDTWCTHSVHYPLWLSQQIPNEITILNHEAFFWPLYHQPHIEMMFDQNHQFNNAYSHHLWESSGKKYLDTLTIDKINNQNTTFTNLVKELI
jgi:hypothetical protein